MFRIGQRVVCVKKTNHRNPLIVGKEYDVATSSVCCKQYIGVWPDPGEPYSRPVNVSPCPFCGHRKILHQHVFGADLFRLVEDNLLQLELARTAEKQVEQTERIEEPQPI